MSGQYRARVLADSRSPDGVRLTTMEATFPRIMLSEFNTHRMLSRNSASSRAIPPEKQIERVREDPFVPVFGSRVKGMGQGDDLTVSEQFRMQEAWRDAARLAATQADVLVYLNADKSHTNRLLEPFLWHTVIVTATEWDNFMALRCHEAAAPEIREIAKLMRAAMEQSEPDEVGYGQLHAPLITPDEFMEWEQTQPGDFVAMVSVGRCAKVSYETHEDFEDPEKSYERAVALSQNGHWSPFEHVASPARKGALVTSNFRGWSQFRKMFPNEHNAALLDAYK